MTGKIYGIFGGYPAREKSPQGYNRGPLMDMLMIPDAVNICGVVGITDNNQGKGTTSSIPMQ